MSTYRLPDWLGGHVVGEILRESDAGVVVSVNLGAEETRIAVPRSVLVEVKPPAPAEPEPGAYLFGKATVIRKPADSSPDRWYVFNSNALDGWQTWGRVWRNCGGHDIAIRRLVPEESAEPVSVPLRVMDGDAWLRLIGGVHPSNGVAFVSVASGGIYLSVENALRVSRALAQLAQVGA